MKAHIFNIDNLLIEIDQKVWVIDKSKPNEHLLKISKEDFDLIRSGVYKEENLSIKFGEKTYYLPKNFFDSLSKKVSKQRDIEDLTFSFREFIDPKSVNGLKINYNLEHILHLKNTTDDIYFITSKSIERKYSSIHTELKDRLKEEGLLVKQIYYLNQSYFYQNKDYNIKKICNVLLSNLSGKLIEDNKFTEELDRNYKEVNYYDSNYVTINRIKEQINRFADNIGYTGKTKLVLNKVTSNRLEKFKKITINFNKYIKKFEKFNIK
jgi:hypothetical protein